MNSDLVVLLRCLNSFKVRYLVVGGYAVMKYTEPRYTKDVDLWVEPSRANSLRLLKALKKFGAPLDNVVASDFAKKGTLFMMGLPPNRFDILTRIKPLTFSDSWKRRTEGRLAGVKLHFLSLEDLIKAKKKTGRLQDKLDLVNLKTALKVGRDR